MIIPFNKNLIYEQWPVCQTYSPFLGGSVRFYQHSSNNYLLSSPFDYSGHNGRLKHLTGCTWGKENWEGAGGVQRSSLGKKNTHPSSFFWQRAQNSACL